MGRKKPELPLREEAPCTNGERRPAEFDEDAVLMELLREHSSGSPFEMIELEAALAADPDALTVPDGALPEDWDHIEAQVRESIMYATQVAEASRRFQELFQGVPIACFCYDAEGRILEWNRACERLFYLPMDQVLERRVWEVVGRVDDREILHALVMSVVAGETYEGFEWQDVTPDGMTRYFLGNVYPLRAVDGTITGGISANINISARKYAEQALHESEERWHLAVRGNNDGIWDWNLRTNQTYFSARCSQILGYDDETEIASTRADWLKHVHPEDVDGVSEAFEAHIMRKTDYYYAEYRAFSKDGSLIWILDRGQALWNRAGDALRVAGSFTDITARKKYEEELNEAKGKLEELASRDGLTGLKNRRAFQERMEMEYERASRYNHTLSIVMLDVDQFKHYNDTYGHPAGDLVLKTVAHLLEAATRDSDFVARYGGEEFVLILPHTNPDAALRVAERCRTRIEGHSWPERAVTASFGVATLHPGITLTRDDFLQTADQALYSSKAAGRNRVTHAVNMK